MKRTKKKPSDKKYWLSEKQLQKIKDALAQEIGQKMFLIITGVLVDFYNWDEDQICDLYEKLAHTDDLVEKGYLKAKDIQNVIEKKTGCKLGVKW